MKRWAFWIATVAALAAVFHVLTVMAVPYAIVAWVSLQTHDEPNRIHRGQLVTSATRDVIRPSPDLLYSWCPFDLQERPVRISARIPDSYLSIAAFSANTDNFFVVNDLQVDGETVEIVLVGPGQRYERRGAEHVVQAPEPLGVVLVRQLVTDRDNVEEAVAIQRQIDCEQVE